MVDFAVFFTAFLIEVCPDKTPPILGIADLITSRPFFAAGKTYFLRMGRVVLATVLVKSPKPSPLSYNVTTQIQSVLQFLRQK